MGSAPALPISASGQQTGSMALVTFDVNNRSFYEGPFEPRYERLDGIAHYAVDPDDPHNAGIVDLGLAPREADGLVHFDGDLTLLRPVDPTRRTAIVEVPNRGRRTLFSLHNRAAPVTAPTAEIDPGDGFLLDQGFTIAWCGWQWDVPRSPARMGLTVPVADVAGEVQLRLQLHQQRETAPLTDQHTGQLGNHTPLAAQGADAQLLVRDGLWGPPTEIEQDRWRFDSPTTITLDGGFEPGRIYDVIFQSPTSPVAGAGLLAVRDTAAFLRTESHVDHVVGTGQSQCGRFLRTFTHLGLNHTPDGQAAFDGLLIHIGGARRGEFNHRLAQPSVQPTPSFGHLFPFADDPQQDPRTGQQAGLLDRQRSLGHTPKLIYTNTASEYWRGDAALAHISPDGRHDLDPPAETRHYLFASTQHGPGQLPLTDESIFGSRGANTFNAIDYTPLMRAALINLVRWVEDGIEPPANAVPRLDDGTATSRAAVIQQLADGDRRGDIVRPDPDALAEIFPLDLGPQSADGIGSYPAAKTGEAYPCFVSTIDDDGNDVAGVAMPDVTVPVASHCGWNPRGLGAGGEGQILDYLGSTVPFSPTRLMSIYDDEAHYLDLISEAANQLVADGYLLAADVETCRQIASARFRAFSSATS